jgi:hypothetical protein
MKKILLIAFLAFPAVTLAQNLMLVCEGTQVTTYSKSDEVKTESALFTYVFKNGKLTETTTSIAADNVEWTDNYIHIYGTVSVLIDRISGKVSHSQYFAPNKDSFFSKISFDGFCKSATQKF